MKRKSNADFTGFTLIELLVVIAVIAILAGILFPVFARVREKANQATCVSNCHQIGSALMMYVQDYDEVMPVALAQANHDFFLGYPCQPTANDASFPWNPYGPSHWDDCPHKFLPWLLQPYMKSFAVFRCPTLNWPAQYPDQRGWDGTSSETGGSYGYYCMHVKTGLSTLAGFMAQQRGEDLATFSRETNVCGRPLAESQNPAAKIVIWCNAIGAHVGVPETDVYPPPFGTGKSNGAMTAVFGDGHSKLLVGDWWSIVDRALTPF